jgi:hypothetical protein
MSGDDDRADGLDHVKEEEFEDEDEEVIKKKLKQEKRLAAIAQEAE